MKKILTVLLMVVTVFAFTSCGSNLQGSYTTNNLINFDFYPDGTYYVATYNSDVQKGEYEKADKDNTYKLTIQGADLGVATYNKSDDNMTIDIGGNSLLYTKTDDLNYKDKYKEPTAADESKDAEKAE